MKEDIYKAFEAKKAPKVGEVTPVVPTPKVIETVAVQQPSQPLRRVDLSNELGRREKISTLRRTIVKEYDDFQAGHSAYNLDGRTRRYRTRRLPQQSKKRSRPRKSVKLTYMPFVIKAAVLAIKDFPIFNAQLRRYTPKKSSTKTISTSASPSTPRTA
ncbi:MAG: 2-oxo acid dehydrogenase subunit E2 [Bacillus subtilis]|nr:2-oxo acid dehydrogenase subunit E2 [Bacillus subtilis]